MKNVNKTIGEPHSEDETEWKGKGTYEISDIKRMQQDVNYFS